jgi:hypothetical protein
VLGQGNDLEIQEDITAGMVGVSKTYTLDFLHDSLTGLTNSDIAVRVMYPTTGAAVWTSSLKDNILASDTTLTSSSASFTTTGMTNPNKQKMSVTFTPTAVGKLIVQVSLLKTSYTVYVSLPGTLS